jgi:hypothetical protein
MIRKRIRDTTKPREDLDMIGSSSSLWFVKLDTAFLYNVKVVTYSMIYLGYFFTFITWIRISIFNLSNTPLKSCRTIDGLG